MKKLILALSIGLLFVAVACKSDSKAGTWSADQKTAWKTKCTKILTDRGVAEADANDYCDCMFEKTSKKYTPEEAESLTTEQVQEIWQECDYSW